jgi:hypothetical protein
MGDLTLSEKIEDLRIDVKEIFGNLNELSAGQRALNQRLDGAGSLAPESVFEAFFDTLASMGSTAHLIRMFDSTIVRAHVLTTGAKGARRSGARPLAWWLHHKNPRRIGRLRGYRRLRPDRRRNLRPMSLRNPARYRARHSAPHRHLRQSCASKANPDAAGRRSIAPVVPRKANEKDKPAGIVTSSVFTGSLLGDPRHSHSISSIS